MRFRDIEEARKSNAFDQYDRYGRPSLGYY